MNRVTVVIPNYNGKEFLDKCLKALAKQDMNAFDVIIVDNCSDDDSPEIAKAYLKVLNISVIYQNSNYGFSNAVNTGIRNSNTEYVILLNNDAYAGKRFVGSLVNKMDSDNKIFSAQALMLQEADHSKVDSAGDVFLVTGYSYSRGRYKNAADYNKACEIFTACAGAAIYRRSVFEEIGYFDENFFAYLEDVDMGYRARIAGYINVFEPQAKVLHVGSGSSGSRHNEFKVTLAARNSILVMYKNFAGWQKIVNAIPVLAGIIIKTIYFTRKGLAKAYLRGVRSSLTKRKDVEIQTKLCRDKAVFRHIQSKLWTNLGKI